MVVFLKSVVAHIRAQFIHQYKVGDQIIWCGRYKGVVVAIRPMRHPFDKTYVVNLEPFDVPETSLEPQE